MDDIGNWGPFRVGRFNSRSRCDKLNGKYYAHMPNNEWHYLRRDGTIQESTGYDTDNSGYFDTLEDLQAAVGRWRVRQETIGKSLLGAVVSEILNRQQAP